MLALLTLTGVALAGGIELEADPARVAQQRLTWAAYQGQTYAGMAMMDGMAEDDGGATLVVRYVMVGSEQPLWVQGITVDGDGELVKVVHREGRRIRSLVVDGDVLVDEIREGTVEGDPLSSREHALPDGPVSNPWLVPVALGQVKAGKGDAWQGTLVDGGGAGVEASTLAWQGKADVGGKRTSDLALLTRESGAWTLVVGTEGVAAIQRPGGVQWVLAPREQVEAAHAQATAARR